MPSIDRLSVPQHLHKPDGIEIPNTTGRKSVRRFAEATRRRYSNKVTSLEPGWYDLTPPGLSGESHRLEVTIEGKGRYRIINLNPEEFTLSIPLDNRGQIEIAKQELLIPEHDDKIVVARFIKDYRPRLVLFEIITYHK